MKQLPRQIDYRTSDTPDSALRRLFTWARDVVECLRRVPDVAYLEVSIPASGTLDVVRTEGQPRSVLVARAAGAATGAPAVDWVPVAGGFAVTATYGVTLPATVTLRVEV